MGASLLVFSNKQDIKPNMSKGEVAEVRKLLGEDREHLVADRMQALGLGSIVSHIYEVVECSAHTGEGVDTGIKWVVEDAKKRMFLY